MLKPAFMAATVLLLLTLVVLMPRLIGPQEDISSLPRLILNYDEGTLIAAVTSLSGTYLYRELSLEVTPAGEPTGVVHNASGVMALEERIPLDVMPAFHLEATAEDDLGQLFSLGIEVIGTESAEGWSLRILHDPAPPRVILGDDLRMSPIATLLERRNGP